MMLRLYRLDSPMRTYGSTYDPDLLLWLEVSQSVSYFVLLREIVLDGLSSETLRDP
jgi:hypothetical protein